MATEQGVTFTRMQIFLGTPETDQSILRTISVLSMPEDKGPVFCGPTHGSDLYSTFFHSCGHREVTGVFLNLGFSAQNEGITYCVE